MYIAANPAACALFGRAEEDIVGHHLSEFIPGARLAEVEVQWQAFLRDGSQSGVFSIKLPDASFREFEFQARANFAPGLHCSFVTPLSRSQTASLPGTALTICAWTKRVQVGSEWISIESYLKRFHGVNVSHGISPDALIRFGSR